VAALEKPLLITGCGRSGTKYTAALLQNLGLDVRHEEMGADGIVTWCMAIESDDSPWGGGRRGIRFNTILQQVRHPLRVIPSLTTFTPSSWEFIARFCPCSCTEPVILRAAKYWYHWNLHAEQIAQWRFRIEAIESIFDEFCARVGVPARRDAIASTSTLTNSRKIKRGLGMMRYLLDRLGVGQSSKRFDFLYDRNRSYVGEPFTWDVLETHAPGWSKRIREISSRYGYSTADDLAAARISRGARQTRREQRRPGHLKL
jgi:hypothetical protein